MRKLTRFIGVMLVLGMCFACLWPSICWHARTPKEVQSLALNSLEKIRDYAVAMAHDDIAALRKLAQSSPDTPVKESGAEWLPGAVKAEARLLKKKAPAGLRDALLLFPSETELQEAGEAFYRDKILAAKRLYNRSVKLGLDLAGGMSVIVKADLDAALAAQKGSAATDDAEQFKSDAMSQAVETLRSRIDRFGLAEPVIRRQGAERIYIELPGAAETDRINSIIMGKGILNFRLVDDAATDSFNTAYRENPAGIFNALGALVNPSLVPEDCEVLGLYKKDTYGLDERQGYLAVKKEIALDGKHIKSAQIDSDMTGKPQVTFTLDTEGAQIFGDFTSAHVNDSLAIVSDDKIKSYARINSAITGGNVAISGFRLEEAQDLQKVLQTAWLSVPLSVESQQVIGAALGDEAIAQGLKAVGAGLAAVLIFMLVWYHASGVNAVAAQLLNLYIMFSLLSAMNLTLTLPGIAGMILTIGMAVDANVVIFERIKDELRQGKDREAAVEMGFKHAMRAILDSNITTFIAAFFMSQLGTGSIQGFAVSLCIGVVTSVFTALFVSRLIFDFGTDVIGRRKLSIGWGVRSAV